MPEPAEPLFEKLTPEVRPLAQQLRELIADVIPGLTETVQLGWGSINYLAGRSIKDFLVGLSPQKSYVNLEFRDGVDLPDPAGRLEGTGKRMRHVKIRSADDVRDPNVRALLTAAARLRGVPVS